MSQLLNVKQQKIVAQEIKLWREERLIGEDLAATLLTRYTDKGPGANMSGALSLLGSILLGLGAILFVAANWQQLAVLPKLALILAAISTSYLVGWRLRFEPGTRPKLGSSLLVLGSLFFGAGIWLVAQIFNMDISLSSGLLIWSFGSLITTLVVRTVPHGCLTAALISLSSLLRLDNRFFTEGGHLTEPAYFIAGLAVSILLARYLRSRAMLWITLLVSTAWMVLWSAGGNQSLLIWGVALFGCYLWCHEKHPPLSAPFLYVGAVSVLSACLCATTLGSFYVHYVMLKLPKDIALLLASAMSLLLLIAWKLKKFRPEPIACILLALASCLTYGNAEWTNRVLANILFLCAIGGFLYTGSTRIKSPGLVNAAILFFVLDVIAFYFDSFFTMIDRSLFFIIGGVILMSVGAIAEGGRRKILDGMKVAEKTGSLC